MVKVAKRISSPFRARRLVLQQHLEADRQVPNALARCVENSVGDSGIHSAVREFSDTLGPRTTKSLPMPVDWTNWACVLPLMI
jgi:hypothetical protein